MKIGELAARFGLAPHVLRHWEEMGLLTPAGRVAGRREYDDSHIGRVVMIQRAKAAGLGLGQMRLMFDAPGGAERRAVLAEQEMRLDELIRQAQESKRLIGHALSCAEPDLHQVSALPRVGGRAPVTASSSIRAYGLRGWTKTSSSGLEQPQYQTVIQSMSAM